MENEPPLDASKPVLRAWAKARRAAVFSSPELLADVSARLCERVLGLPEWQASRHVLLYLSLLGEVSVESLMQDSGDKRFYVPRCAPKRQLVIHPYLPDHTPLVSGVWGLREPDADRVPAIEPGILDLAIVPALLLTQTGDRLGYGGGYYDRFLTQLSPTCKTIGLLPSPLIVSQLPIESWDVPLNRVITEAS